MYSAKVYEDLDGHGVKFTGGYDAPDLKSTLAYWTNLVTGDRKPGSYATLSDSKGEELARMDW